MHEVALVLPTVLVPALQGVHADAAAPEYVPAAQELQAESPPLQYVQAWQADAWGVGGGDERRERDGRDGSVAHHYDSAKQRNKVNGCSAQRRAGARGGWAWRVAPRNARARPPRAARAPAANAAATSAVHSRVMLSRSAVGALRCRVSAAEVWPWPGDNNKRTGPVKRSSLLGGVADLEL